VRKPTVGRAGDNEGTNRDSDRTVGTPEIYTVDDMRPISKARQQK